MYVLRCIQGEYSGRFLFINMTEGGEVFGSADPEENQQITMYIENADLSAFHASIQYINMQGKPISADFEDENPNELRHYMLTDHGSKSGTWLSIKSSFSEH